MRVRVYGNQIFESRFHLENCKANSKLLLGSDQEADAALIFSSGKEAAEAILEAESLMVPLIILLGKGIPLKEQLKIKKTFVNSDSRLITAPGLIIPGACLLGIMPPVIFRKGDVAILSASSSLAYEAICQTTKNRLGQSVCMGLDGQIGSSFMKTLELLEEDPQTKAIIVIGCDEELTVSLTKPLISFKSSIESSCVVQSLAEIGETTKRVLNGLRH